MIAFFAVDTSVWIESIIKDAKYYHIASRFIESLDRGAIHAMLTPITASEVFYIAYRVYRALGATHINAENKARMFFERLYTHKNIRVILNKEIALLAGKIKSEFGISLSDSYILALAEYMHAVPLFRAPEKEMKNKMKKLKERFHIMFLSELKVKS
ncbi:MAG: type II toxin-antitoxin system VapC family toxin [Candidatus Asgardarchaeia archaeon]